MCWKRFHPSKVKSGQWSCVLMMAGWPVTKRHTQKRTWCQQQNENLVALDFKIYTMKINMTLQHAHLQYRKYIFKRWMFHCRVSFREGGKFANIDSEQIWPRIQNERKHSRRDELCLLKLFPSCAKQCGCDSELRFQRKPHNDHIYYSSPLIGNHCNGYINPLPLRLMSLSLQLINSPPLYDTPALPSVFLTPAPWQPGKSAIQTRLRPWFPSKSWPIKHGTAAWLRHKNGTGICSQGFFIRRDGRKPHLSRWSKGDLYIESSKLIGHGFSFARRDSNRGWMHSLIFYLYIHFYSKVPRSRYRNWDWNPTQRT